MQRRNFIALLGRLAVAWPIKAQAQQTGAVVGILHSGTLDALRDDFSSFREGLRETGFYEGKNVNFEYRVADGQMDKLPGLAENLVRNRVALIFAGSNAAPARAAKEATSTIPIVFFMGANPVELGIVDSLARPGGNITGVTLQSGELFSKRLEILLELLPKASRVGYLINPTNFAFSERALDREIEISRRAGVNILILRASNASQLAQAFYSLKDEKASALLVGPDSFFQSQLEQLVSLAARHAIPTSYSRRDFVLAGGLISYGADVPDPYRRAGVYAGRILKGEKPNALPVQQPTRFKLAINLKSARQIGIEVPPVLLARADEVIE